ncbi:MAG: Rieske 2Fe-2S domain-containing protein [Candidatus Aminicenantales bacterium]|jgi:cytochrome b6-f complex iron-sulfur subunit
MNRRKFINIFLGGTLAGSAATLLYPVIRYLLPPRQAEATVNRVRAAKTNELAPNTAKIFKFGSQPAVLVNTAQGELKAFAATCTHLSCTVFYEASTESLFCPCHGGRFDLAGHVVAGPPPAPLETYQVEVVGEDIIVSKRA